ncbi:ClpP/crotonase [Cryphonectria parasitica EP155]|uniref:ClpP/crotonase n=1 Tax=Cryphonectria parasitica (strain ATCC 38755 / EP155) TaxID=660469 RepID=A0A9P4Y0V9_CRYP1|nr:ClpP/crotonase [Cryphonectria parasitica EP155]KAF3764623.1 ClpP/crotonase [Cryphonectria parasitica EP155]
MADLPSSYETLKLPTIRFSHHPPSSPMVTPIILVILDRPAARNAFNTAMMTSLEHAFHLLSADPRVRCIVLTGSDPTNQIFCAGMDLTASPASVEADRLSSATRDTHRDGGGRASLAIFRCHKPVVAAVNGSAVGVGATMTLPCAVRVTHRRARIGFVFARRGLVLEGCSSFFLPRLLGASRAVHLATTGAVCRADAPLLDGLFTLVEDPAAVLPRALAIAEDVVRSASVVSAVVMRDMIYRGPASPEEAHLLESKVLFDLFSKPDFVEGVKGFVEKRDPVMEGTMPQDGPSVWPWWEDVLSKAPNEGGDKAKL